jgi:hypothetical protein
MSSLAVSPVPAPELGKYRLIAKLARGGMGDVYLAVSHGPGGFHKLLVVKEMRPEFAEDERYVAMFLEEARLAARLAHPNIVQTNEVGADGTRHFMTMEYLDGRSLYRVHKQLAGRGGLPLGAHLRVIAEALLGLHYAHELRGFDGEPLEIVHRDVSPLNIFVTFDGQAKVLDFGIAKAADSSLETQAGVLKGRLAYMAPEQASGGRLDRRADIYAVGVMIWEAAAGRRLWPAMSDVEIFTRTLGEGPPPLLSVRPEASPELAAVCARAMARRPDDRYPTAAALLADLDRHLSKRDDAVSIRELGALVSGAFEVERRQMNATIEEALATLRAGPQSGVMSTRAVGALGAPRHELAHASGVRDDIASLASLLGATPSTARVSEERPTRPPPTARPPMPTVAEGFVLERRNRRQLVAMTCAVAATAALAVVLSRGVGTASAPAPAAAVATAAAPAPAPPSAPPSAPAPASASASAPASALTPNPVTVGPVQRQSPPRLSPSPASARPSRFAPTDLARPTPPVADGFPAPAPTIPAASVSQRPEVDPAGGRAPMRPIVTSNPYGAL